MLARPVPASLSKPRSLSSDRAGGWELAVFSDSRWRLTVDPQPRARSRLVATSLLEFASSILAAELLPRPRARIG
jgi:hypothetical protein